MTMNQCLDWKLGKFLEWCIHLPYENRPQTSPVFLIKNINSYFELTRNSNKKFYYLYLKSKSAGTNLEPFSLTIYFTYTEYSSSATINRVSFKDSNTSLFSFPEAYFIDETLDLSRGFSVRFLFALQQNIGLWLLSERKVDGKSAQTDENSSKMDEKSIQADFIRPLQTDGEDISFDFGELLKSGNHSDVQLLCKGGNIAAHKAILAARSKAFSDMVQNSSEESKNGVIDLTTTEKSVVELCLEFIYKDKILNLPLDKAPDLYVLGHVLKMSSLSRKCADLLIYNLCEDNYISYLVLADKYDDNYFKCGLIDYISDHVKLLISEGWMTFTDEYMKTAIEVYKKCMLKFI